MKPVLLIYPGKKAKNPMLPLSVLALASYLKEHRINVEVLDARVSGYKGISFKKYLLVGISVAAHEKVKFAYEISAHIRAEAPSVPIVWGGPLPSALHQSVCKSDFVDIVVKKEGEKTLLELARCISISRPLDNVEGITFKKEGRLVSNPDRKPLDMDDIPLPAYGLVDLSRYNCYPYYLEVETSRGCVHDCSYCYAPQFSNRVWRAKNSKKLVAEIKLLKSNFSIKHLVFCDRDFFLDKKRVLDFCIKTAKSGIGITWDAYSRPDTIAGYSSNEMALLKRAGLNSLMLGAESGSQHILDTLGKGMNVDDTKLAVSKCARQGIKVLLFFMLGAPSETWGDVKETLALYRSFKSHPLVTVRELSIMQPMPGSKLYDKFGCGYFGSLDDIVLSDPLCSPWLSTQKMGKLRTISRITAFWGMHKMFKMRGKQFKKSVLGNKLNTMLWNILSPLAYLDATLRFRACFFIGGYEWRLISIIANKTFRKKVGQF